MSYSYRHVGTEDPFVWEEPAPEHDASDMEKLFALEPEQPRNYGTGLADHYLRARVGEAGLDVHQLQDEIVSRRRMMDRQIEEIDSQVSRAAWSLKQLDFRVGYNAAVDFKRNWTERELANLRRERRNLRLRCWEDIVTLRRQLREATKQYRDSISREELMEGDTDGG